MSQVNANQGVLLYDASGNPISSSGGALAVTGVAGGAIPSNIQKWNGATVAAALADAPAGTEIAPVVRDIFRKQTTIETTTPLAGGATFTGAWHDTELDGTVYVNVFSLSNVASAGTAAAVRIEATDDTSNASMVYNASSSGSNPAVSAGALGRGYAVIKARYWRVVYVNGASLQGSFELTTTATNVPLLPDNLSAQAWSNNANTIPVGATVLFVGSQAALIDNNTNSGFGTWQATGGAGVPIIYPYLFNGGGWDRPRNNVNTATGDTGAKLVSVAGATVTNFDAVGAYITVLLGTVSGTGPTLTAQLQYSPDGGTTWINLGPVSATVNTTGNTILIAIHPTNFSQTPGATPANLTTGATTQVLINAPLPRTWRLNYTIAGTNPSFTISSVGVNYIRG